MKNSGLWLGLLLLSLAGARGQVTVEVVQTQTQFLPGEALKMAVRITNLSGRELQLGQDENWLTFEVESRDGIVVPKTGEVPVIGEFTLESSKAAIKRVDLAPYFVLPKPGSYQIVAIMRIRGWNREIVSNPKTFDIIQGAKLWEQEVGLPNTSGAPDVPPEIRRYILQQAISSKGHMRLYVRITDGYGKTIRVTGVGPLVSFGRPEAQVDKLSNLHVLSQEGASNFAYTVWNPQGDLTLRQTYDHSTSRPRLRMDDDGVISIRGGARRIATSDIPAPSEDDSSDAPEPERLKTNSAPAAVASPPGAAKAAH
jgi:hypothetical protein